MSDDKKLIDEAATVAKKVFYSPAADGNEWHSTAEALRDFWAAHTEPALGEDMPTVLRKAAGHMEATRGCQYPNIWAEADRLEAAQATRERDLRIGRAILKQLDLRPRNDDPYALRLAKAAREAVEAES